MEKIEILFKNESSRLCSVYVGSEMSDQIPKIAANLKASKAFVLCDSRVQRAGQIIAKKIRTACKVDLYVMEANEQSKDLRQIFPIFSRMIESKVDRHSVLFAVGGGVVGDVGGFVASTYLRGIRWVGIPTTLLAQVDSSVGGKTAVNHPLGKNLIGTFCQPSAVVGDVAWLHTLAERDRVSGFGEMLKYGLACDAHYFDMLVDHRERILSLDPTVLPRVVATALRCKLAIVRRDERETRGLREVLNFGHTIGHAFEAATRYHYYRHGEAVIWGMRLAAALSVERGCLEASVQERIDHFLSGFSIPKAPTLSLTKLMEWIHRDKKTQKGQTSFVLLNRIGGAMLDMSVSRKDIQAAFRRLNLALRP